MLTLMCEEFKPTSKVALVRHMCDSEAARQKQIQYCMVGKFDRGKVWRIYSYESLARKHLVIG